MTTLDLLPYLAPLANTPFNYSLNKSTFTEHLLCAQHRGWPSRCSQHTERGREAARKTVGEMKEMHQWKEAWGALEALDT